MVEYALMLAFLAAICIAVVVSLGLTVRSSFNSVSNCFGGPSCNNAAVSANGGNHNHGNHGNNGNHGNHGNHGHGNNGNNGNHGTGHNGENGGKP